MGVTPSQVGFNSTSSQFGFQSTVLTVLGAEIPRLKNIVDVGGGVLVQNVPNQNFSNVFGPLRSARGALFIAGNNRLTSLAGSIA